MLAKTKAVLFDLDGVLIHSERAWLELTRAAIRDLGDGRELSEEYFRTTLGTPMEADVERWFPTRTAEEVAGYYAEKFFHYVEHVRVDDAAPSLLAWLKENGVRTAVVTNAPGALARELVPRLRLPIEKVMSGTDVARAKPAPDLLLHALVEVEAMAYEAIMVGDTDNDRLAAQAAEVRFIGVRLDCSCRVERLHDVRSHVVL